MDAVKTYTVDLTDPDVLDRMLEQYLGMDVCLVAADTMPDALEEVAVQLQLGDDTCLAYAGQVIQFVGRNLFLVQFHETVDSRKLRSLLKETRQPVVPEETRQPAVPEETRQPAVPEEARQPAVPEEARQLAVPEEARQPAVPEEARQPAVSEEARQPAESEEARQPAVPEETRQPEVTGRESDTSDVYKHVRGLSIMEKQKLAKHCNQTVRHLLIKDPNKNIHIMVVQNPKITLGEILEYTRLPGLSKDAIKLITQNRTWMRSRQVSFNLVRNPSTPVDLATRLMSNLGPNEWRVIARSTSVKTAISTQAKKLLASPSRTK